MLKRREFRAAAVMKLRLQQTVDAKGNLLTHTDDLNHTTNYTYDGNNNTASVSQQLNASTAVTTTYTYNSFGEALGTSPPTPTTQKGNLTSVTSPAPDSHTPASVTQFAYNILGELTQITDPLNHPTT
jgi:YD repeat-containing protein